MKHLTDANSAAKDLSILETFSALFMAHMLGLRVTDIPDQKLKDVSVTAIRAAKILIEELNIEV